LPKLLTETVTCASSARAAVAPVGRYVHGVLMVPGRTPGTLEGAQPSGQCRVSPVSGSVYEPAVSGLEGDPAH
jgi:hypothetical protein